jgi:hypothetical protein
MSKTIPNDRLASRRDSGQDRTMPDEAAPEHPIATPRGAAAFAALVGLTGLFAPVFLDARGAVCVGVVVACVIGWIYWKEAIQAWREGRWHAGLALPLVFILVIAALTAATAHRLTQGGKDENVPVLSAIASLKRDVDSSRNTQPVQNSNKEASSSVRAEPINVPTNSASTTVSHQSPQSPQIVLERTDVERLMDYGNYPGAVVKSLVINHTDDPLVIQSLHLLEVDYLDSSMDATIHGIDKFGSVALGGGMQFPSTIFFPGQLLKAGNTGAFEAFFDPSAVLLDGNPVGGPITIPAQKVVQITAQFPTRVVDRKATNAIAGGLMFDIVTQNGNIDRRICPGFSSIVITNPMGSGATGYGPIGRQPATLWPPQKDTPLCALAPFPNLPRAASPYALRSLSGIGQRTPP